MQLSEMHVGTCTWCSAPVTEAHDWTYEGESMGGYPPTSPVRHLHCAHEANAAKAGQVFAQEIVTYMSKGILGGCDVHVFVAGTTYGCGECTLRAPFDDHVEPDAASMIAHLLAHRDEGHIVHDRVFERLHWDVRNPPAGRAPGVTGDASHPGKVTPGESV